MLTAIKKSFQKRAFEALRSSVSSARKRYFTPFDRIKSVVLLYRVGGEDSFSDLYPFIDRLEAKGAKVDTILVGKQKDLQLEIPNKYSVYPVGYQEVKWNGTPKNEEVLNLLQNNHDYFIDLARLESSLSIYLATASLAKFKIGGVGIAGSPFDLTLDVSDDADLRFFEEQMFAYLPKIV